MIIFNVVTNYPERFVNTAEYELSWIKCEYLREVAPGIHEFMCTYREEGTGIVTLENLNEVSAIADLHVWDIRIRID